MTALDRSLLLGFLDARTSGARPVAFAIYRGLSERINRGDFDTRNCGPYQGKDVELQRCHSKTAAPNRAFAALNPGPDSTPDMEA